MDYREASVIIPILETSISYCSELKLSLINMTDGTSNAHYNLVKESCNKLDKHINDCSNWVVRLKSEQREKWESMPSFDEIGGTKRI